MTILSFALPFNELQKFGLANAATSELPYR